MKTADAAQNQHQSTRKVKVGCIAVMCKVKVSESERGKLIELHNQPPRCDVCKYM